MRRLWALLAAGAALLAPGVRAETWPTPASELARLRSGSEADRIEAAIAAASSAPRIRESAWALLARDSSSEVRVRVLLESAGRPVSDELAARLAELALDDDEHVSEAALVWLRGATEVVLPALSRALFSGKSAVRAGAALSIGELKGGPDEAREGLLIGALRDSEPKVRAQAARALGASARERALPSLSLLLRDPDPAVRKEAARALAATGDETAAELLRQVIGELVPRVPAELLAAYLETEQGRTDPLSLRLLVATLQSTESRAGLSALERLSPSPWIARLFELSSTAAGHETVRRLLQTLDLDPTRPASELLEARARDCALRESELLCHKWVQGLSPEAASWRAAAYRARRLTAFETFDGVRLSESPELQALALELLEGKDREARRAALRALEWDDEPGDDLVQPLAFFLERSDLAYDEVSSALRLLGRSSTPKAQWLVEKHEESTVTAIRTAATSVRLEQLLSGPEPDCAELQRRAVEREYTSLPPRARRLSRGALECLVSALDGRPSAERGVLLDLLLDARLDQVSPSKLEALAAQVFSLSRRARGAERSLLVQLTLRLGVPRELLRLAREGRLESSSLGALALALRMRGASSELGALENPRSAHELITLLDAPSRLERIRAMLDLRPALATDDVTGAEKAQIAERACLAVRGRDDLTAAAAIAFLGALGPREVGEACWLDATVRSYMSKDLPQRMAAVFVAQKWPEDAAARRVLRLCRLGEQEVGLVRWCARDSGQQKAAPLTSGLEGAPKLVSRRLVGGPGTRAVFLSFTAEHGALSDLQLELVDAHGPRLVPEGRETVLAFPL
jgi:HEAT repeat protein